MTHLSTHIKHVAVIGGGTIGASWAAYFLSRGLAVTIVEPYLAEETMRATIDQMWLGLTALGLPDEADNTQLTICRQIDQNLADVDFVQENSPENLALKQDVVVELEQVISPKIVISSSTSSLLASDIQTKATHPARILVGHPFNPPHLLPLVEVVGGQQTSAEVVTWAMEFYREIGKQPVHVKKEVIGHIANRLTAALYREAVHIVAEGIGTVADVDAVMTNGPGPRWALMGPHLTYHLGGGSGGIQHYMAHLGPTQEHRWQELGDPKLTEAVQAQIIEGVLAEVGTLTRAELAQWRDDGLIHLLKWLSQNSEEK